MLLLLAQLAGLPTLVLTLLSLLVAGLVRSWIKESQSPLSSIPGPWLAKYTRLWLFIAICSGKSHITIMAWHKSHGPIIRIGPNEVSIDDPVAADQLYRFRQQLQKSRRYSAWGVANTEPNIFSERDIGSHTRRRAQIQPFFQPTKLKELETQMDTSVMALVERLKRLAESESAVDIVELNQCSSFDFIGQVTFGKPFGFLRQGGGDIHNLRSAVHQSAHYGAVVGVFSEWHGLISRVTQWLVPPDRAGMSYVMQFTIQTVQELHSPNGPRENGPSFLSQLLAKHSESPEQFSEKDIYFHVFANVAAGAETTASGIAAAMFCLWSNPAALLELRKELVASTEQGAVGSKKDCTYLEAVIKEALRLHPPVGLWFPRVIPEGGMTVCGHVLPEGVDAGINPFVAHQNRAVFGDDSSVFRPERWIEADSHRRVAMENYWIPFGRGPRVCIGKDLSLMEMRKVLVEMVLQFDLKFQAFGSELLVDNHWFVSLRGIFGQVSHKGSPVVGQKQSSQCDRLTS